MNNNRTSQGNTLVLVIVGLFALLLIAYVVLNYSQLFATHKEAQTAIDAASLAAAKDMSQIVIDEADGCHFGVVGLVDNVPRKKDNRPVIGINTLMATVRLDAIIANKLGNSTMLVLTANDLQNVQADCLRLRKKIVQALKEKSFSDKDGNKINILDNANNTFDTNAIRLGGAKRTGDLVISVGQYSSPQGTTNIPVPTPTSLAQVNNSTSASDGYKTIYKPLVDVPVAFSANGSQGTLNFKFLPIGNDISLISSADCEFPNLADVDNWPGYLPPFLVKVEADQRVQASAQMSSKEPTEHSGNANNTNVGSTVHAVSIAICGGARRTFGSGLLQVSMPGGPPPQGQGPDCTSIQSIMNSTQISLTGVPPEINSQNRNTISATHLGTASNYVPAWNKDSTGSWLTASGGAVPATPSATLKPGATYRSRLHDDPSVVLSFCVYDWLHAMYLRPNAQDVADKLMANLNLYNQTQTSWNGKTDSFFSAAYATTLPKYPVTFGLFNVPTDGINDPRDLRNFDKNPEGYRRQLPNIFGYVAADATLPDQALVVAMDENSNVVTTNGQPPMTLVKFYHAILRTNSIAQQTFKAALAAMKQKAQEVHVLLDEAKKSNDQVEVTSASEKLASTIEKGKRARIVATNAHYAMTLTLAMLNDRKALSGLGITQINDNNFEIIGGNFLPPTLAATTEQILGDNPIPTGQDTLLSAAQRDWAAPPSKDKMQFVLFQSTKQATSSNIPQSAGSSAGIIEPVYAASAVPQSQNNMINFKVINDVSMDANSGTISLSKPQSTSSGVNVIQGQLIYQNTSSLITTSNDKTIQEVWNCVARDNGANYSGGTSTTPNSYFGNPNDAGYNSGAAATSDPPLLAEWTLRCPAPVPTTTAKCITGTTVSMPVGGGKSQDFLTYEGSTTKAQFWNAHTGGSATAANSALAQITVNVDAAGNVTYLYQGLPVHFFTDEASWTNSLTPIGGSPALQAYVNSFYVENRGDTKAVMQRSGALATAQSWWAGGTDAVSKVAPNTALTQAEKEGALWSLYSQITFYTVDANMCARLYVWSS